MSRLVRHVCPAVLACLATVLVAGCTTSPPPTNQSPSRLVDNIYVADYQGYVLKITPDGTLSLLAGNNDGGRDPAASPIPGPATSSPIGYPEALAADRFGNVFIAELTAAHSGYVDRVTSDGVLSVVAGNGDTGTPVPGPAIDSPLWPTGVAVDDSGNLYIAGLTQPDGLGYVAKVTPDGTLTVIAGPGSQVVGRPWSSDNPLRMPGKIAVDGSGNVYVTSLSQVMKVTPDGTISIVAGRETGGMTPSPGPAVDSPLDIFDLAADKLGNLYVAQYQYLNKISPDGVLSIVAGTGSNFRFRPGPAVDSPITVGSVAICSSGDIIVVGSYSTVLRIDTNGILSVIAGTGVTTGDGHTPSPGPATASRLNPVALAAGPA